MAFVILTGYVIDKYKITSHILYELYGNEYDECTGISIDNTDGVTNDKWNINE